MYAIVIELPSSCERCTLFDSHDNKCFYTKWKAIDITVRAPWCPVRKIQEVKTITYNCKGEKHDRIS